MSNPYVFQHGERTTIFCIECIAYYDLPVTAEQIARWKAGELIQRAMPHLTNADRELFISGLCGTCWIALFGAPPELATNERSISLP